MSRIICRYDTEASLINNYGCGPASDGSGSIGQWEINDACLSAMCRIWFSAQLVVADSSDIAGLLHSVVLKVDFTRLFRLVSRGDPAEQQSRSYTSRILLENM